MRWERRRESLCQRQSWYSGSWLHILCFSYLISKNTFFVPSGLHVSGLLMCACCLNSEAEREHFVVSFLYEWPFTLEIHLFPPTKKHFCVKSCLFIHRSCTAKGFIVVISRLHSECCMLNKLWINVMCNLFLGCCLVVFFFFVSVVNIFVVFVYVM